MGFAFRFRGFSKETRVTRNGKKILCQVVSYRFKELAVGLWSGKPYVLDTQVSTAM